MAWVMFFTTAIAETWAFVYFFDTFLDCKWSGKKALLRFPLLYLLSTIATVLTSYFFNDMWAELIKMAAVMAVHVLFCEIAYETTWGISALLSVINYTTLVMFEFMFSWGLDLKLYEGWNVRTWLIALMVFVFWGGILLKIRKKLHPLRAFFKDSARWLKYTWFPIIISGIGVYFIIHIEWTKENRLFFAFVSGGLAALNIVSLFYFLHSLEKDEKLKNMALQIQKKQDQIQMFYDTKSMYERQGKKLHDYKKQLASIQELLESDDNEAAKSLVRGLNKSISVELSEVNTGNPVVNAVLNQEYKAAKGKGIGMLFSVADMRGLKMQDEDVVVLFGNLLENAIHECEKIMKHGNTNVAIQVKLAEMDGGIVFTVQNPVLEKVRIEDNSIVEEQDGNHGIGLTNVREVAEKYDGNLAISCDDRGFIAAVLI